MRRAIKISAASLALLEAHASTEEADFKKTAHPLADGGFEILVDDEVLAGLEAIDKDPDRAIAVLCSTGVGHA